VWVNWTHELFAGCGGLNEAQSVVRQIIAGEVGACMKLAIDISVNRLAWMPLLLDHNYRLTLGQWRRFLLVKLSSE